MSHPIIPVAFAFAFASASAPAQLAKEHRRKGFRNSYPNSVLPLREVDLLLPLSLGDLGSLVLGESSAQRAGQFGAEVEREVRLVLVEQAELRALAGVDDGEDAGD